ncbi:MAG: hypothetical protein PVG64_09600 [Syntrophobacterales bacterium]|jgi:hypothetical protein
MLGLNSLSKLFRKTIGPRIEALGLLPHRYYLHRALDALEADDIDEAVRMVTLAAPGKRENARWRLVCQQVVFRCRVLASRHEQMLEQITLEMEIFGKNEDLSENYLRLKQKEGKARDILKQYERFLMSLLTGDGPNGSKSSD